LATSLGFVAVIATAFFADAIDSRRARIAQAERDTRNTASLVAEQTKQILETADLALKAVILAHHEWRADPARTPASGYRLLSAIQRTTTILEGLGWTDRNGDRIVSSVFDAPPPLNIADQPQFRVHMTAPVAGLHIGAPLRSRLRGDWISLVSRRINGENGEFQGVASAILNAGYISSVLERYHVAEQVIVSIYLRDGSYLARFPDPSARLVRSNRENLLFREHLPKSEAGTYHGIAIPSGEERIFSYRALAGYPVVVAVSMRRSVALAAWHDRIRVTGAALLLQARRLRQQRQAARLAQLAAEEANRGKSEFLAHMSHELRTPMNAVLGFTEMMTKEIFGPIGSPRYREYLRDIEASGQHLLQVINNILDLAKVEAGKWEMNEVDVDMGDLAHSTALLLRERARAAGVTLAIDDAAPKVSVRGDLRLLRQIILNLLTNAIKFSERGGTVELPWKLGDDGALSLSVVDHGLGMTPEEAQRALRPYANGAARARNRQDTGLGLSLSKHFAEMHGGQIAIDSALGRGTTVTIRFPAERVLSRGDRVPAGAAAAA
jgi:signal transduction histidine kinase